ILRDAFSLKPYEIVAANILADVIEPLCGFVHNFMKEGGYFISCGIIDKKEQDIVNAVNANEALELVEVCHDGDWVSVIAKKK
ncbi:MAG: 50S ribosomal protein L11 methyltransferase, partial [Parasporobacterium sp.]|nr:50S ribosomal protein L11 methyltransferase [Parasporobacterium sp.]